MEKIEATVFRDDYCLTIYIKTELGLLTCITKTPRQNKYVGWRNIDYFFLDAKKYSDDAYWKKEPIMKNIRDIRKFIRSVFTNCIAVDSYTERKVRDYLKDN